MHALSPLSFPLFEGEEILTWKLCWQRLFWLFQLSSTWFFTNNNDESHLWWCTNSNLDLIFFPFHSMFFCFVFVLFCFCFIHCDDVCSTPAQFRTWFFNKFVSPLPVSDVCCDVLCDASSICTTDPVTSQLAETRGLVSVLMKSIHQLVIILSLSGPDEVTTACLLPVVLSALNLFCLMQIAKCVFPLLTPRSTWNNLQHSPLRPDAKERKKDKKPPSRKRRIKERESPEILTWKKERNYFERPHLPLCCVV